MTRHRHAAATAATVAALVVAAPLVAGCGRSTKASAPTTVAGSVAKGSGPVDVLFAGSLVAVMRQGIGPAFDSATGYTFTGTSGDSGSLANQIKSKTAQADVFVSASPAKDQGLEGAANGGLVTWYATFATSALVLGYSPSSKFASSLQTSPWYTVIGQPGFLVGRTDPTTDPKGALTVKALDAAVSTDGAAALTAVSTSTADVFPEDTLVGRLQAGQLDAGFFYAVEAATAKIATLPLTGVPGEHATYTITVPTNSPHPAAAAAFVAYLLGPKGATALRQDGLTLTSPPEVSGTAPSGLDQALSGK